MTYARPAKLERRQEKHAEAPTRRMLYLVEEAVNDLSGIDH